MRSRLVILLIAIGVCAGHVERQSGWKLNKEYQYLVESRTLATFNNDHQQSSSTTEDKPLPYTGVLLRTKLTVQPFNDETIRCQLSGQRYAQIHTELPRQHGDWNEVEIDDTMLDFKPLAMSCKNFEIKMRNGVVRGLVVDKNTPTWEVNILKSIVSQLQVDTMGENAIWKDEDPEDEDEPYGTFKVMEDTVGGQCEVMYDMAPLDSNYIHKYAKMVPLSDASEHLKLDSIEHISIVKTKNYGRCLRRSGYHSGIDETTMWKPGANDNGRLLSKASTSKIVITGSRKTFIIQSSVTTNKVFISPRVRDDQLGLVQSRVSLTLWRIIPTQEKIKAPENPQTLDSLVYTYNEPFADHDRAKDKKPKLENLPSFKEDSSSSESDSMAKMIPPSWEGDAEYWQTTPNLHDPPETPILPVFIGYNGKSVAKKIDPVKMSRDLVHQIESELKEPDEILKKETLEKFNMLSEILRTMSYKQMTEAGAGYDEKDAKTKDSWVVFRDAVSHAGTGPALLMIKDWIGTGKMQDNEAANVMNSLVNSVRNPTPEYIEELFTIASSPKVTEQPKLSVSSILAFTELVRRAAVNMMAAHSWFPVHSFGRFVPRHDNSVVEKYIPYLAARLKEAVEGKDSVKAQLYVVALGNLGHPAILSAYEPYLEGKIKTTKFMRLLMVTSMSKLAVIKPKLARSIFYRIYTNILESHEVRCAAVYLLMTTDPPLPMLQRMAEFTNSDISQHVSAAVKSSLEALADSVSPDLQKLAEKARIARDWLTRKDFDMRYSHSFMMESDELEDEDDEDGEVNRYFNYRMVMSYIGSDNDLFPNSWYFGLTESLGGLKAPPNEIVAMISSVSKLLGMFVSDSKEGDQTRTENIAKMLGIVDDWRPEDEPLEGNLLIRSVYSNGYLFFDQDTVLKMGREFAEKIEKLTKVQRAESTKLMNYEIDIGFPTETGLPFTLSIKTPSFVKTSVETQIDKEEKSMNSNLQLLISRKIQTRAGFVTPFDHQEYIAGVDTNVQVFLPGLNAKVKNLGGNSAPNGLELQLRPNSGTDAPKIQNILHYSTIPFTARHDVLDQSPVSLDKKNTHVIRRKGHKRHNMRFGKTLPIAIDYETDNPLNEEQDLTKAQFSSYWYLDNRYTKLDLYWQLPKIAAAVSLKMSHARKNLGTNEAVKLYQPDQSAFPDVSKVLEDPDKRNEMLMYKVAAGIKSPKASVLDFVTEITSGTESTIMREIFSVAWASSGIDEKSRALVYWRNDEGKDNDDSSNFEMCASIHAITQPTIDQKTMMTAAMMPTTDGQPMKEFTASIGYGRETCMKDGQIYVKGKQWQSAELAKQLEQAVEKCNAARSKEMENDNMLLTTLEECKKVRKLAYAMNQFSLSVKLDENTQRLVALVDMGVDSIRNVWASTYDGSLLIAKGTTDDDEGDINVKVAMDPDFKTADASISTSTSEPVIFHDIPFGNMMSLDDEEEATCILEDKRAVTLDGKSYNMDPVIDCSVVVMTTYPKNDLPIPTGKKVSVVKRTTQDYQEVTLNMGDETICLKANKDDKSIDVTVNGEAVKVSTDDCYRAEKISGEIHYEIYRFKDGSVGLVSTKYDIQVTFDGKRIMMKVSDDYRNSVRGLCGNYDGDAGNDFRTPTNCLMHTADFFVSSFALTEENCKNHGVMAVAAKLKKEICAHASFNPPYNVIKSLKTSNVDEVTDHRHHKDCNVHATKYVYLEDEICFSTRPVPVCVKGCRPKESRPKKYSLYCLSKDNEEAQKIKDTVDQGARPDFTQKPSSRSWMFTVPIGCRPVEA